MMMNDPTIAIFGILPTGEPVQSCQIANGSLRADIITYGAALQSLFVPDRNGTAADIVLGYDNLDGYLADDNPYFSATVGRFANRIAGGRFRLNGRDFQLTINNDGNHLHGGGARALSRHNWQIVAHRSDRVTLATVSPDGEEGYPGTLRVQVSYTLTADNTLAIDYEASSDQDTPINLTNHTYWNLAGTGTVGGHLLRLAAHAWTPRDANRIPTGEIRPVAGTALDLGAPQRLDAVIPAVEDFAIAGGLDHNFVLGKPTAKRSWAAVLHDPASGRTMEVSTTEPGIQVYTANFFDHIRGKNGRIYNPYDAICLETQHFPDSVNQPRFPSAIVTAGSTFRSTTIHRYHIAPGSA